MARNPRLITLLLVISLIFFGLRVSAQITNARLSGTVADASGAAIAGASVTAKNIGTSLTQTVKTGDNGTYTFNALPVGSYSLTVVRDGFAPHVEENVVLTVGQSATLDVPLKAGGAQDTVTVTGGVDLINTTTAEISTVIGEDAIRELPLDGRDPSHLVYLSGGVTDETQSQAASTQNSQSFNTQTGASAGGGRQGSTWYLLDGVPNMDTTTLLAAPFPNADATQEFRVITNNFDARYGFAPNAVVSIGTKSGTNAIHGGVFYFIRNYAVNAKYWFPNAGSDTLKRNQFGGFVGAPIIKDRLFAFANYQATRASFRSVGATVNTPTAAMLQGDFSGVVDNDGNQIILRGPFTMINNKPNQVDPALFSKGAVALAKLIPLGQDPHSGLVSFNNPAQRPNYNEGTGRLDLVVNQHQRMFARIFIDQVNQPGVSNPGNILSGVQGQQGLDLNTALNHTWTISDTLLNSITAAYISYDFHTGTNVTGADGNPLCISQFVNVQDPPGGPCSINVTVSNGNNLYGGASGFSIFSGQPYQTNRRDWVVTDTLTKVLGKHTLAAGVDVYHRHYYEFYGGPVNASFGFNGSYTGFIQSDFLLGYSTGVSQGSGEIGKTDGYMVGTYLQDQYKLRSNVTLNAGIRWDPNLVPSIEGDRGAAFIPGKQSTRFPNAPAGMLFSGEQGIPSGLINNSYGYFQPRVGIAWQAHPKLAVRAGFGLFTTPMEDAFYNRVWDAAPFNPNYNVPYSAGTPDPFDNPWSIYTPTGGKSPFPPFVTAGTTPPSNSTFALPQGLSAVFDPNLKLGITQSWNASVEQQFGASFALHLVYVGSQSFHQATTVEQNPGQFFGAGNGNNGARTTYPNFQGVLQVQDGGTASYHAAQVGFEKRYSHGFQFQSNFTWSKSMDVGGSGDPTFESSVSDPYDIHHDHGPSSLNYPFVWVSNFLYRAPAFKGHGELVRHVAGGWEISGIYTAQSGPPFTINGGNGNNNSYFDVGQDRADLTGQPFNVRQGGKFNWVNHYFNVNAFQQNALGTPGSIQKFNIQEAPIQNVDLGIMKNFAYRERFQGQFRFEAFNALNHPSFGQPDSNPGDSNFGQITGLGPIAPRRLQAALKLTF